MTTFGPGGSRGSRGELMVCRDEIGDMRLRRNRLACLFGVAQARRHGNESWCAKRQLVSSDGDEENPKWPENCPTVNRW